MIALFALAFTLAVAVPVLAEDPAAASPRRHRTSRRRTKRRTCARRSSSSNTFGPRTSGPSRTPTSATAGHIQIVQSADSPVGQRHARRMSRRSWPSSASSTSSRPTCSTRSSSSSARRPTPRPTPSSRTTPSSRSCASSSAIRVIRSSTPPLVRVINRENASVVLGPKAEFEFALRPDVAGDAKAPIIKTEVRLRQIERHGWTMDKPTGRTWPSRVNVTTLDREHAQYQVRRTGPSSAFPSSTAETKA